MIGLANGLAWTETGGDTLEVETLVVPGTGKYTLTGQLGDVMKESCSAALSFVRSLSGLFNLSGKYFKNHDFHIHVPEGAIPKDGPSAGVAIVTSLVSAVLRVPVRNTVAMTGEITLRGRVLPIGGLKEKVLAAHRAKIKTVLIPKDNEKDLKDIPAKVLKDVKVLPVEQVDKVLIEALEMDSADKFLKHCMRLGLKEILFLAKKALLAQGLKFILDMKTFVKNILANALIVFVVISATFFLRLCIPGDPVDFILQEGANLEDKELLREEMGLNKSVVAQYKQFLRNTLLLDFGKSVHTGEPVLSLLFQQIPSTFFLSFSALFLAVLFGIPLGLLSAHPSFRRFEKIFDLLPMIFFSIPVFISAPLLIWFFGVYLKLLPVSGSGSFSYILLPALSLALPLGAVLMKVTRASVLELLFSDFVRTAKSKGLSFSQVYFKHILKNAFIPVLTILGLQLGALLTGTVIVESVFDRPGVGSLLYGSIVSRDYPLIQVLVLFIALIYIFINRGTDWLYTLFQPLLKTSA